MGLLFGDYGSHELRDAFLESDCIISFGAIISELNTPEIVLEKLNVIYKNILKLMNLW